MTRTIVALICASVVLEETRAESLQEVSTQQSTEREPTEQSLGESLENLGRIYQNNQNDTLQELWLLGRYHGQYHWSQGPSGNEDDYETRRFRLGAQAKLFNHLTLHAQAISGADFNPGYNGFTELWAQWSFMPELALTIGQQKNRFTHDRNVSSRYINTIERAMLTNMFAVDYTPAVTLQGKINKFTYYTGIFSNATGRNIGEAFTQLDSGYSFLTTTYYDLGATLGAEHSTVNLSYVRSDANQNATNLNRFDDGVSAALIQTRGRAALVSELTGGFGSQNGSAIGLNLQPSYFFTPKIQIATRYQLARSTDSQGLQPQKRYERLVAVEPGDLYQAGYVGLNYYIAKHRLKLMTGVEYASMSGSEAWTVASMIRFYFGPHSNGAFPMNQILPLDSD